MSSPQPSFIVQFTALAYGGDAIGRLPSGKAVFAPFVLPGETASIRLTDERRGYARGEVIEILEPSPARIAPRCIHFGVCGGCAYQNLSYPDQVAAKTAILSDQLTRLGGISAPPLGAAIVSPEPYGYRNHLEFHQTPDGRLGFHRARSEEVFPLVECHLPQAAISQVWPRLDLEVLPEIERIGLRVGAGDDVQLILSGAAETPELDIEELEISAVHLHTAAGGSEMVVLGGSAEVEIEVLERPFRVSAASFFQANTAVAARMVTALLAELTLDRTQTLLEVYCGVGLFSAFLAPQVGHLVGVESSPSACDDFVVNLDEFDHVDLYEGRAEEILPALSLQPEVLVVDPPRTGLPGPVLDAILAFKPQQLAYISCDAATLGRDAKRLTAGGYRLRRVIPVDQFPQTYAIESLTFWEPGV